MTEIDLARNADVALRMVREAKDIAYDTETSGVNWRIHNPVGYVLTTRDTSVYVPIRHGGGGNLPDVTGRVAPLTTPEDKIELHPFELELAEAFRERGKDPNKSTIGHNMIFDCHMSANAGIYLGRNVKCTQNTQTLVNEYTRSFSLESLANGYGVTAKLGEELYEHMGRLFDLPGTKNVMAHFWRTSGVDRTVYDYAAGDGFSTIEVWDEQMRHIEKQDLSLIHGVEMELIWTLFRMERRGLPVDGEYVERLINYVQGEIDTARQVLPEGFNPRSSKQMQALMESQGCTDWPLTEKGNPSFVASWLKGNEMGRHVVAMREWTNLLNSFVMPLREDHVHNGRVHASINQNRSDATGTISGRLSCSHPNMQAVPKHNRALAAKLRAAFVAEEGMVFAEADYSQIEPRLFAHYAQCKNLLEGYKADPPQDVHTLVANMMKVDRGTTGKRMNMGMFTGIQVPTFATHMGVPQEEAARMWREWYSLFPEIRDFQNLARDVIKRRGYVRTLLGRRGRLEQPRWAYKGTSKIIQGGNADIVKYKLVEIDKELEKTEEAWLTMSIHDSILWMAPEGPRGVEISNWIVSTMEDLNGEPFNLSLPIVAELDMGRDWAEASYGSKADEHRI